MDKDTKLVIEFLNQWHQPVPVRPEIKGLPLVCGAALSLREVVSVPVGAVFCRVVEANDGD